MIHLLFVLLIQVTPASNLTVQIDNIKNSNGYIYVALYSADNDFPTDINKADKIKKIKSKKGTIHVSFLTLKTGNYAVSVFQDSNSNGILDTSFLGIPKEPTGVSNNAKGGMGPPSFKDCKFNLIKEKTLKIRMEH